MAALLLIKHQLKYITTLVNRLVHRLIIGMQRIFEALSSAPRRRILAYLAHAELNAGQIAARFDISKPAVSQHLAVLENAGLIASEKRGQFVFYRLVADNLANTLNAYVQEVCPVARPIKAESARLGKVNGSDGDAA